MNSPAPQLSRATEFAHQLIRERVSNGDSAVDATVGNGHDTFFLAELVGPEGSVTGFDIQQQALDSAALRLGDFASVTLHCKCHSQMDQTVTAPVRAVMFNLGYLPSADKSIITLAESTLPAIDAACRLLQPGGIVTIVVYTGHPGGSEEAEQVERYTSSLPQTGFSVIRYQFTNQVNSPPYLIAVSKK